MDDTDKIVRNPKSNRGKSTLQLPPRTRIIDCMDSAIDYQDVNAIDGKWRVFSSDPSGGSGLGAYGGNLKAVNSLLSYCQLDFDGADLSVFCRKGPGLVSGNGKYMDIFIDDLVTPVTRASLTASSNQDRVQIYQAQNLSATPHTIRLQRGGSDDLNQYIVIDYFRLDSILFSEFIEGSAVFDSRLSIVSTGTATYRLKINDVDRTSEFVGSNNDMSGDYTGLNVSKYISRPGLFTILFVFTSDENTQLSATLTAEVKI